jgi:hypothetical protein
LVKKNSSGILNKNNAGKMVRIKEGGKDPSGWFKSDNHKRYYVRKLKMCTSQISVGEGRRLERDKPDQRIRRSARRPWAVHGKKKKSAKKLKGSKMTKKKRLKNGQ